MRLVLLLLKSEARPRNSMKFYDSRLFLRLLLGKQSTFFHYPLGGNSPKHPMSFRILGKFCYLNPPLLS